MKKILGVLFCFVLLACFISCESTKVEGSNKKSGYTIKEGDGVVAYFTFDEDEIENDIVIDHSGLGNDADTNSLDEAELVEGYIGNALFFNGEDQYLSVTDELLSGEGFTISMWVNPTGWKDWQRIFDIGDGNVCDCWAGMDFETKQLRFDVFGSRGAIQTRAPLPKVGEWTHVAVTLGNGTASLYVNGKTVQSGPCAVSPEDIYDTVNGIYIGRSNWAADPLFFGAIDEILLAKRAFSSKEVASLFKGISLAE